MARAKLRDGEGRMSVQKRLRQKRANRIVKELKQRLNLDDVADKQAIFSRGTLKKKKLRCLFSFIAAKPHRYRGRFFTERLCKLVVKKLRSDLENECELPASKQWFDEQARRFKALAQRAKKLEKQTMDNFDTLPMFVWFSGMRFVKKTIL